MLTVPVKKLPNLIHCGNALPDYKSIGASGLDLGAAIPAQQRISAQQIAVIDCGFALAIPPGYEGQIRPRSGLALQHQLFVLNAPGTIDCDYRGEIKVILANFSQNDFIITPGMRVAQLIIAPVVQVTLVETTTSLPTSQRNEAGLGSTGIN